MVELFSDKCSMDKLLNGPFSGDVKAFERLLGASGVITRTRMVAVIEEAGTRYYSRTDAGKVFQQVLDMQLNFLDKISGGEVWGK